MYKIIPLLLLLLSISYSVRADDKNEFHGTKTVEYQGEIVVLQNVPTFEEFPGEHKVKKMASSIRWNPDNWDTSEVSELQRESVPHQFKKGANFNGHYVVADLHDCGTECHASIVIDVENGKEVGGCGHSHGVEYRMDSALLICNQPRFNYELTEWRGGYTFYAVHNGELVKLKEIHMDGLPVKEKNWKDE